MQRPEDIRKMINKQCDFLADDNDDDLKEYTIMKLNDLTLQYQVVLNGHGTTEWYEKLVSLVRTENNSVIFEHLRSIDEIPYPTKFKEDVKKLVVKFCVS